MIRSKKIIMSAFLIFFSNNLLFSKEKIAVFIVSAGRSGSSCMGGVLDIMGVEFGDDLRPATQHNEKGTFEDYTFLRLCSRISRQLGIDFWLTPRIIDWNLEPKKNELKEEIKQAMIDRFSNSYLFGIKNSFIAFQLPLFIEAARELGYTPKIIAILRDPTETARSWRKRFPSKTGTMENLYEMIGKCFLSMLLYGLEEDFLPIYFNDLFSHTEEVITKLHNFLPGTYSYETIKYKLAHFLDKDLKHENNTQPL